MKIHRSTLKARARQQAFADAHAALRARPPIPRASFGDALLEADYLKRRRELCDWLRARSLGVMFAPPGGVSARVRK